MQLCAKHLFLDTKQQVGIFPALCCGWNPVQRESFWGKAAWCHLCKHDYEISLSGRQKPPCVFARDGLSSAQPILVFLTKGWLSPSQQFQLSRYETLITGSARPKWEPWIIPMQQSFEKTEPLCEGVIHSRDTALSGEAALCDEVKLNWIRELDVNSFSTECVIPARKSCTGLSAHLSFCLVDKPALQVHPCEATVNAFISKGSLSRVSEAFQCKKVLKKLKHFARSHPFAWRSFVRVTQLYAMKLRSAQHCRICRWIGEPVQRSATPPGAPDKGLAQHFATVPVVEVWPFLPQMLLLFHNFGRSPGSRLVTECNNKQALSDSALQDSAFVEKYSKVKP